MWRACPTVCVAGFPTELDLEDTPRGASGGLFVNYCQLSFAFCLLSIAYFLSLIFKVKIDTTTIPKVIILVADHSSLFKCNLNIGL